MKLTICSLIFACAFVTGLSAQAVDIEKIIGANDLIAVNDDASNVPLRYRKLLNAFGKMDMGCTVTHIGNGYALTAGHCFWAPPTMVEHTSCDEAVIQWGHYGNSKGNLISKCEEIVAAQYAPGLDFAIIKVSPAPDVSIPVDLQRRAAAGDSLTMFSHPDELPLHWSQHCGVENIDYPIIPEGSVKHRCDTNPGSSGATMLNLVTLKIIAIHDGGHLGFDGNGMNYGTFIATSPIVELLKNLGF